MKSKIFNRYTTICVLILGMMAFYACKDEEIFEKTRLFRPVLTDDLYSEGNSIIVNMGKLKDAVSYTLEVSRDTFKTIEYTIEADTNFVVINSVLTGEELLWFTIYQVRAIAHASDSQYDSKVSDLGNVRTQKYPSNQGVPTSFDVTDIRARVFWTTAGDPVTEVKVFAIGDLRLETPLMEFEVTDEERDAEEKIISGLDPETEYQIAIYSDGVIRGWEVYTTKTPEPSGDNVIDLKGIYNPSILVDTLPDIPGGSIVILESGLAYETGGYEFDKSITFRSGYGFSPNLALIDCSSNFNLSAGSSVDAIVFQNIAFKGSISGNYVFNIGNAGSINTLKFDGCEISNLRGVLRMKDNGPGLLSNYLINNCVIDSIGGYGLITVDVAGWVVDNIILTNSTFSKVDVFIRNNKGVDDFTSIVIDGCTASETPKVGNALFRFDQGVNVTNGIKIHNTIWGHGWNTRDADVPSVTGTQGFTATSFDVVNVWATSDFSFSSGEIPGFPSSTYSKTAADLWVSPYTDLDFNFKDTGFSGKGDSGDPRWRMGL